MASSTPSSSEEQFLCSICLEVFSEPVSTPCGHNFCKRCISQAWNSKVICKCPLCNKSFSIRAELCVNTLLSEMISQATLEKLEKRSRSMENMPKLRRRQQREPVDDLEDRECPTHDLPPELHTSSGQKAMTTAVKTILILILICLVSVLVLQPVLENKDRLRSLQMFAVDVTLDPNSAHPHLVLSEDLKQVHDTDVWMKLPDSPQRFDACVIVLGKQSFSSGRFYFEVQVKGKTDWILGVARGSVNRKGEITVRPEDGFWTIVLRDGEYSACDDPAVRLSLQKHPQKVGVFVDYGAGLVSFYDVDSADLLYSFTGCSFKEKLFPFFYPGLNDGGRNSAPLIISAVETK